MKRLWIAFLCLFAAAPLYTDQIEETVVVDLVDLYFTATNEKGQFVTDLKREELTVTEDGVSQKVERFGAFAGERNEIPLVLALVIDNSASMDGEIDEMKKLDLAREAAKSLLNELGPLDRVQLVQFSDTIKTTDLVSDRAIIQGELSRMQPRWWHTALFDAVAQTTRELSVHAGRKILLLCSDGQDNMSTNKLQDVIDAATRTPELTVIVLGTVGNRPAMGLRGKVQSMPSSPMFHGKEILQEFADKTAGYAFFPKNVKESQKVFDLLRGFVRSQYYLAYRSTNTKVDGSFRKIHLQAKRKGITLRYRPGYYAN